MPPRAAIPLEAPAGLVFQPDFLTPDEERALVAVVESLPFEEVVMHGQAARRTVHHFGLRYRYDGGELVDTDPLPESLLWLRDRCAALAEVDPERFVETLIGRYPPGAGIGWHRDAPMFGTRVAGVSLLSPCRMRFQRTVQGRRSVYVQELPPRSAYVLSGAARWSWQHTIPPVRELRYSITFRTLRGARR